MRFYRIQFWICDGWVNGLFVQMRPSHFPIFIRYLNGEIAVAKVRRRPRKAMPTRVRAWNGRAPDFFYKFDGLDLHAVKPTQRTQ